MEPGAGGVNPEEEKVTEPWMARLHRVWGKVGPLIGFTLLAAGAWGIKKFVDEVDESMFGTATETMTLDDAKVTYTDFKTLPESPPKEPIKPTASGLRRIINEDYRLLGIETKNQNLVSSPENFKLWIEGETANPDVLAQAGISEIGAATSKDLVEIAVAIVAKNLSFDEGTLEAEKSTDVDQALAADEQLQRTVDTEPVDKILMNHIPVVCRHYSTCVKEVFKVLKGLYPEKLTNVYVKRSISYSMSHSWNIVLFVDKPDAATAAFIDPTLLDNPDYGSIETKMRQSEENFLGLIESFQSTGVLSGDERYDLASKFLNSDKSRLLDLEQFIQRNQPKSDHQSKVFLNLLLKLRDGEGYAGSEPIFWLNTYKDVLTSPYFLSRPADWREKSEESAKQILELNSGRNGDLVERIPGTPEEYFSLLKDMMARRGLSPKAINLVMKKTVNEWKHTHPDPADYRAPYSAAKN